MQFRNDFPTSISSSIPGTAAAETMQQDHHQFVVETLNPWTMEELLQKQDQSSPPHSLRNKQSRKHKKMSKSSDSLVFDEEDDDDDDDDDDESESEGEPSGNGAAGNRANEEEEEIDLGRIVKKTVDAQELEEIRKKKEEFKDSAATAASLYIPKAPQQRVFSNFLRKRLKTQKAQLMQLDMQRKQVLQMQKIGGDGKNTKKDQDDEAAGAAEEEAEAEAEEEDPAATYAIMQNLAKSANANLLELDYQFIKYSGSVFLYPRNIIHYFLCHLS